jgi:putative exosortase-associated protein (TIGR04073 family)
MAKKIVSVILVLLFVASSAAPAYCDNAFKKLGRGACNILMCPVEFPSQIADTNKTDGPAAGLTYGVIKGIYWTLVRGVVGVYEVVTFPIPVPCNYRPILTEPEFMFDNMSC